VGAEATAETPASAKETLGPLAYAVSGMRKLAEFKPYEGTFTSEHFNFSGEFLMFAVGLTRSTGGGTMVTPMASATDGLLDLCIVEAMNRREFAAVALKVKRGEHVGHAKVHYKQLRDVTVEAPEALSVNVDGENTIGRRFTYRARPRDLWVHVAYMPGEG
jgi:diacylglycerol kinase family enzyme